MTVRTEIRYVDLEIPDRKCCDNFIMQELTVRELFVVSAHGYYALVKMLLFIVSHLHELFIKSTSFTQYFEEALFLNMPCSELCK